MNKLKKIIPVIIAIEHYIIILLYSNNTFDYSKIMYDKFDKVIIVHCILLFSLILFYELLFYIISNRDKFKEHIKIFLGYFILQIILLLIVWPRCVEM